MTDTTNRPDTLEADSQTAVAEERQAVHTDDLLAGRDPSSTRSEVSSDDEHAPLFANPDDYRQRWQAVQAGFVDEPRRAVEDADALVAEVVQQLVTSFAEERKNLEGQWSRGDQVSTEDLRVALRRYRSFFDRLLST